MTTDHNKSLSTTPSEEVDTTSINRQAWNKRSRIHVESAFYDVAGFLNGNSSLNTLEKELLGDVTGQSLLHLQCHFGLDTLSLARMGARVTGVDLSSEGIEYAIELAKKSGLDADFVCADVLSLDQEFVSSHDVVFTSYGVLCWLNDLDKWAVTIARALKQGGRLCLVEFHPFFDVLSGYPYFHHPTAYIEQESTYTENHSNEQQTVATWAHSLSDVVQSLIKAGLVIEHFAEYSTSPYECFEGLTECRTLGHEGHFEYIHKGEPVPLLYSICATKT